MYMGNPDVFLEYVMCVSVIFFQRFMLKILYILSNFKREDKNGSQNDRDRYSKSVVSGCDCILLMFYFNYPWFLEIILFCRFFRWFLVIILLGDFSKTSIEIIKCWGFSTIDVKPPIAYEVLLIKYCSVWT